jgi:predicted GH43/DUF377 family glycosyl hydrolase
MILQQDHIGWPRLKHRCADRLLYAKQDWQHSGRFTTPCIFTCGGVLTDPDQLIMTYGAADEMIGVARTNITSLIQHIKSFDQSGKQLTQP